MSPAAQAAIIGGIAGGLVGGIFTLLGVVVGLFGERWVRRLGRVRYETDWYPERTSFRSGAGDAVLERRLRVTFLNRKDVDVTVWEMAIVFYKDGKPLEEWGEWERPRMEFVNEDDERSPLSPVTLPSRKPVRRTIRVAYDKDNPFKLRALEEADRAVFVARMDGAWDKRKELLPPW